jgi:hypothetical protein
MSYDPNLLPTAIVDASDNPSSREGFRDAESD